MSLSYSAYIRICGHMINSNLECIAELGPAILPNSPGIAAIYGRQRTKTCFNVDGSVHIAFRPNAPNARTFRLGVDRIVANAEILYNETKPTDWVEDMNDNEDVRDLSYLLTKFEELRSAPTDPATLAEGAVPGLGMTSKALDTAVQLTMAQDIWQNVAKDRVERHLRLRLIKEMLAVYEVFARPALSLGDRTYKQVKAAELLAIEDANGTEDAVISSSAAGGGQGSSKRVTPKHKGGPAGDQGRDSKYKMGADMRREGSSKGEGVRAGAGDAMTEQVKAVGGMLRQKVEQEAKLLKTKEEEKLASLAYAAITNPLSYEKRGDHWKRELATLQVSAESMDVLCDKTDSVQCNTVYQIAKDLKTHPLAALRKYVGQMDGEAVAKPYLESLSLRGAGQEGKAAHGAGGGGGTGVIELH
jgi:hypothetical protein